MTKICRVEGEAEQEANRKVPVKKRKKTKKARPKEDTGRPADCVPGLPVCSQFDMARCPKCNHVLVPRMTSRGPAVPCPCTHPNEFYVGRK